MAVVNRLKSHWAPIAKATVWLTGMISTFLITPPQLHVADSTDFALRFVQFILAVAVGLFFIRRGGTEPNRWRSVSLVALVAGGMLFYAYTAGHALRSVQYNTSTVRIVVGSEATLSKPGREKKEREPATTDKSLVDGLNGVTELLWPREELVLTYMVLFLLYTAAMLSLSIAALAMVQFVEESAKTR